MNPNLSWHSVNNDIFCYFAKIRWCKIFKTGYSLHRSEHNVSNMKFDMIILKFTQMRNPRLDHIVIFLLESYKLINRLYDKT